MLVAVFYIILAQSGLLCDKAFIKNMMESQESHSQLLSFFILTYDARNKSFKAATIKDIKLWQVSVSVNMSLVDNKKEMPAI